MTKPIFFCTFLSLTALAFFGCSSRTAPYKGGPVMNQESIEKTFRPILEFMEYKPGMTFADVGAGSGALTVMMATLMENSAVYIQDIDNEVLSEGNVNAIIDHYTQQSAQDLRRKNQFFTVIGEVERTKLPDGAFDLIYSNATVHNFTAIDSMMVDIGKKLKPDGVVFFRDSFKNDHGAGDYCADRKCRRPLLTIDEFLAVMNRNGFTLVKRSPDMSGYPVFGFKRS